MKDPDKDAAKYEKNSAKRLAERKELVAQQRAKVKDEIEAGPERDKKLAYLDELDRLSEDMYQEEIARIRTDAAELRGLVEEKKRLHRMAQFQQDMIEARLAEAVGPRMARAVRVTGIAIAETCWVISRFIYNLFPFRRKETT